MRVSAGLGRALAAVRYDTGRTGSDGTGHTGAGGPLRGVPRVRRALRLVGAGTGPGLVLGHRVAGV